MSKEISVQLYLLLKITYNITAKALLHFYKNNVSLFSFSDED